MTGELGQVGAMFMRSPESTMLFSRGCQSPEIWLGLVLVVTSESKLGIDGVTDGQRPGLGEVAEWGLKLAR